MYQKSPIRIVTIPLERRYVLWVYCSGFLLLPLYFIWIIISLFAAFIIAIATNGANGWLRFVDSIFPLGNLRANEGTLVRDVENQDIHRLQNHQQCVIIPEKISDIKIFIEMKGAYGNGGLSCLLRRIGAFFLFRRFFEWKQELL